MTDRSVQCLIGDHTDDDRPTFESALELGQHIIAEHTQKPPWWWRTHTRIRWTLIELRERRVPLYAAVLAACGATAMTWSILH